MAWGTARCRVQIARALEHMPETRRALDKGEVSLSSVRVLAAARDADPLAFARSESQLVDAARIHSIGDLHRVVALWRLRVDREHGIDGEQSLRKQRRLHASVSFLGMVRVDGDLDPETGETLLTALGAILDAEARGSREGDDRTPAQRRADALGEICRQWLDLGDRRMVAGERPHLTVTVAADALPASERAKRCASVGSDSAEVSSEFDHVGPTGLESARRIACDAAMMRIVMGGRSEPLDVGRRTPVVSPAMRRAVILRDRRCRFPGCDRPHTWCDAHHIVHWADGGPTAVTNLVLLCRRHHRAVHGSDGFRLSLEDGRPLFRRPDGTELAERAPP